MQYVLLIYEDERIYGGPEKNGPALQEMIAKHMAFSPTLGAARKGGAGLKGTASATTVRASNGNRTVHDGPFAETKEQLGGYYLVDVPDLDAAIAIAKRLPLSPGGAVEIRPLLRGRMSGAALDHTARAAGCDARRSVEVFISPRPARLSA